MAGRLILMKNSVDQIKGDCEAEGFKEWLKLDTLSFGASAMVLSDSETGTAHQSAVQVTIPFGPWVAELQQRLYNGKLLGDVELVEVEQKVDAANKKSWKKVRELKLQEGWLESLTHGWAGIGTSVACTIQYTDTTFSWADKVAHFQRSEKS
jgi:hypothetical protein